MKKILFSLSLCAAVLPLTAQTFTTYTTSEGHPWQTGNTSLQSRPMQQPSLIVGSQADGHEFRAWGTCFNELDLDAMNLLTDAEQQDILHRLFAPDGDLRFTRGRLTMNANDYSRAWYSCDTVSGDFQLRYFNIDHDRENVIHLIHAAQQHQPALRFWMSPWSPPAWMKINQDYPVLSSRHNQQPKAKDYLLYEGGTVDPDEMQFLGERKGQFPRRLATQDYMIQDPRYLQAYANMFVRFIELYKEEGINIDRVMYQNEAYSYTPYPGCAWTAEGTVRFNRDYLAPTLRAKLPDVHLWLGTFNTNRLDYVERIVGGLEDVVEGIGLQWEGRENLSDLRSSHPSLAFISSESECGNGSMDWRAAEHTFFLLSDYIGRGCEEYYIWNFVLCDNGISPWGWKQNALIQVNSQQRTYRLTDEYYAVKHFARLVPPGSRMVAYNGAAEKEGKPLIVFRRPTGKHVVIAGNFTDEVQTATVQMGRKYLNLRLAAHSFASCEEK